MGAYRNGLLAGCDSPTGEERERVPLPAHDRRPDVERCSAIMRLWAIRRRSIRAVLLRPDRRILRFLIESAAPHGVTSVPDGPVTVALARVAGCTLPGAGMALGRLMAAGWLRRMPLDGDEPAGGRRVELVAPREHPRVLWSIGYPAHYETDETEPSDDHQG
ncbi:hypothetical protein Ppa06_67110 [Planomonospora parontospora subsp. parontospora]|uniref:Uncharacterized protein n=2 Tax=Planomonospora parontospora TaxID=58119 RepID=A0AA37BNH3_9ACTN|nr:hypothetical protein GCM10010126_67970 [Planomonospora parontospora]GII12913.1 hypothetical protein Ppa06_67110 [Planomonospora parontospora subsp. parontospora]